MILIIFLIRLALENAKALKGNIVASEGILGRELGICSAAGELED
jgi:hypothetical protein